MKCFKGITMFLTICAFLLTGCNKTEEATAELPTVMAEEVLSAEPKTEKAESKEAVTEESQPAPQMQIESRNKELYDKEGKLVLNAVYEMISVEGEAYESLAKGIKQWSEENEAAFLADIDEYAKWVEEDTLDSMEYTVESGLAVTRADSEVVSFTQDNYSYLGGAHGNYGTWGYTFDSKTGKQLEIADIMKAEAEFIIFANEYIITEVEKEYAEGLFEDYKETITERWESAPNWYLDDVGITFIFNPYEIGPYAMGDVKITLPYNTFEVYVKDEY